MNIWVWIAAIFIGWSVLGAVVGVWLGTAIRRHQHPAQERITAMMHICTHQGCRHTIRRTAEHLCGSHPDRATASGCGQHFCHDHLHPSPYPHRVCQACMEDWTEEYPEMERI